MASSIETTSTTTTLKNNGNAYMTVDASDVVSLTNPLPVASGGTGVTSSTGSGNVVLSASPTFTGTVAAAELTLTTPLPVASGGIGATSLNGINVGIGVNQTWTNVLASRAVNTTYTNSTGKPIFVLITCSSGTTTITGTVDALTFNSGLGSGAYYNESTIYLIVPNGSTYKTNSFGAGSQTWFELR